MYSVEVQNLKIICCRLLYPVYRLYSLHPSKSNNDENNLHNAYFPQCSRHKLSSTTTKFKPKIAQILVSIIYTFAQLSPSVTDASKLTPKSVTYYYYFHFYLNFLGKHFSGDTNWVVNENDAESVGHVEAGEEESFNCVVLGTLCNISFAFPSLVEQTKSDWVEACDTQGKRKIYISFVFYSFWKFYSLFWILEFYLIWFLRNRLYWDLFSLI